MAAILQRKSSGGIIFVKITKFITKENVPRNYFVIISARMVSVFSPEVLSWKAHKLGGDPFNPHTASTLGL